MFATFNLEASFALTNVKVFFFVVQAYRLQSMLPLLKYGPGNMGSNIKT